MTTTKLLEASVIGCRTIQKKMTQPDEDWAPVMLFKVGDGHYQVAYFEVGDTPDEKSVVATGLANVLASHEATEAVIINSVWVSTYERDELDRNLHRKEGVDRPSERINRFEALAILYASKDTITSHHLPITRHDDKPPTLGDMVFEASGLSVGGLWADALRVGLQ